jgi:cbb3-type cytochrome oxidase subunit 3
MCGLCIFYNAYNKLTDKLLSMFSKFMLVYICVIYFNYFSRNLKEKKIIIKKIMSFCYLYIIEDGLIVISLRLRFLSCCGVTGNSLFPGSAVKYLENISHSFSSPALLMCTPLTSFLSMLSKFMLVYICVIYFNYFSRNLKEKTNNNKTLNARLLARVLTGCHYT